MKRYRQVYLFVLIPLVLLACQNKLSSTQPQIGEEVNLKVGEQVVFKEGMTLQFNTVMEDSRCPEDVQCVWAGNAEIIIHFNQKKRKLNTFLEPKQVTVEGYTIRLKALSPYPQSKHQPKPDEYVATFLVTRKG